MNNIFFELEHLYSDSVCNIIAVESKDDSTPIFVYYGNGVGIEDFKSFVVEGMINQNPDLYDFVNLTDDKVVCFAYAPKTHIRNPEILSEIYYRSLGSWYGTFFTIVEYNNIHDLIKYVEMNMKEPIVKYDSKRGVYYQKVKSDDTLSWLEFGKNSSVPLIRFENCRDISEAVKGYCKLGV